MKLDINMLVRQMAAERDIEAETLVDAVAEAISSAARKHYKERNVHTDIDVDTGEVLSWIARDVVEEVEDPEIEVTLEEAREIDPEAEIGGIIKLDALDTSVLGRIAAQSARQVLFQRVREAERAVVYKNYSGRVGDMINGIVKRMDRGALIVELGDTEGIIPRSHQVRHERYSQGDRVRAVVVDVTMDANRPQVVLSRTSPMLLEKLLEMEVPEIYDGTVIIKVCVREPGERAKVAVFSKDSDVDPVGACVGLKGSRVQAITRELKGEKIDIIPYNNDLVTFAQNALSPAKINRVAVREEPVTVILRDEEGQPILDEAGEPLTEEKKEVVLDVIVGTEQLSLAIGKRGQNVRLASQPARLPDRDQEPGGGEGRARIGPGVDASRDGGHLRGRGDPELEAAPKRVLRRNHPPGGDGNSHRPPPRAPRGHGSTQSRICSRGRGGAFDDPRHRPGHGSEAPRHGHRNPRGKPRRGGGAAVGEE